MIEQIYAHWGAYMIISTILTAVATLPFAYVALSRLRYEERYRKHLKQSAWAMARLAVFDSWVRSGGRLTVLMEDLERSLREEYAAQAMRNGDDYYQAFQQYEAGADEALMQIIQSHGLPTGVTYAEADDETYALRAEGDDEVCEACSGTGKSTLPHYLLKDNKTVTVGVGCTYCGGTGKNHHEEIE